MDAHDRTPTAADNGAGGLDPKLLERLRRGVPLRMDATGELWFGDERVTHPRVREAIRCGLDLSDGNEPIMRLGSQWCYLTVDDCMFRATAVAFDEAQGLCMRLDDGRTLPLDPDALWEESGRGLRTTAPARLSGRPSSVRFTNTAQMDLAEYLEMTDAGFVLCLGDGRHPIRRWTPEAR